MIDRHTKRYNQGRGFILDATQALNEALTLGAGIGSLIQKRGIIPYYADHAL